jgi:hypothetical protein
MKTDSAVPLWTKQHSKSAVWVCVGVCGCVSVGSVLAGCTCSAVDFMICVNRKWKLSLDNFQYGADIHHKIIEYNTMKGYLAERDPMTPPTISGTGVECMCSSPPSTFV